MRRRTRALGLAVVTTLGLAFALTACGSDADEGAATDATSPGDTLVNLQVIRDAAIGFGVPDPDMETAAAQILANLAG